jgi:hypothetical protein
VAMVLLCYSYFRSSIPLKYYFIIYLLQSILKQGYNLLKQLRHENVFLA